MKKILAYSAFAVALGLAITMIFIEIETSNSIFPIPAVGKENDLEIFSNPKWLDPPSYSSTFIVIVCLGISAILYFLLKNLMFKKQ